MVCVLLVSGVANAGYTCVVGAVDASDGQAGSRFVTSDARPFRPYLSSNEDGGRAHDYTSQLPTSWDSITRAELSIRAWDVDFPAELADDVIALDGQTVGLLAGYLTDGVAPMFIDILMPRQSLAGWLPRIGPA